MAKSEIPTSSGSSRIGVGYFLGGVVIGGCLGILFAPKSGSEMRADLGEWGGSATEKAKSLGSRIYGAIPTKVKAAAGLGAVKSGAKEGFREVKSGAGDMLNDVKKQASDRLT